MKHYIQPGKSITVPAVDDTISGDPVMIGSLKGIASNSAKVGEDLTISRDGVYGVTKVSGSAWAVGDKVYLKSDAPAFTKTSTDNTLFGFATVAAGSSDVVGEICLADAL